MNTSHLLATRRFLPLFAAQFLGAFNDNLFKNAALVFILFGMAGRSPIDGTLAVPLAAGIFVLPFFLFSATAGALADRFDKAAMIRITKAAEIATAVVGAFGLVTESVPLMLTGLFLLGTQATFFGPLKYAILPEALRDDELVSGNALIEGGTFLAILAGTILGGIVVMMPGGTMMVAAGMVGLAAVGFGFAMAVPSTGHRTPGLAVRLNAAAATVAVIRQAATKRAVFLSILGLSWFWLIGAVFLSEFPSFVKDSIGGGEGLVTLFMTVFSIGVGIGSVASARLLGGEISARYVPLASIGVALAAFDLWAATHGGFAGTATDPLGFVGSAAGARVLFDLLAVSVCGGVYAVPLYAVMQAEAEEHARARVIAANNVLNAAFMVAGSGVVAAMLWAGASIPDVFLVIAVCSVFVAIYICTILPQDLFKSVAAWLFRRLYRVEVTGLDKLAAVQGPVVLVANHVSWLDGPLMNAFIPGRTAFAINSFVFATWWGRLTKLFATMIAVDPTNPMSTKTMIKAAQDGHRLVIFPEGRLTVTGSLMKVYDGPAVIADKAGATIVPVKLEGVQHHPLNRLAGKLPKKWFPKITIDIQDPVQLDLPGELKGRARRKLAGQRLYDVMSAMMFQTRRTDISLFQALVDASRIHGRSKGIVEDVASLSRPTSYGRVLTGAFALGRAVAGTTARGEYVGVLLPNTVAVTVTFFALQATGRVPAMLNFSVGAEAMLAACAAAEIRTVLTSRAFVERARLGEAIAKLAAVVTVVYLEDVKERIGLFAKLAAAFKAKLPTVFAEQPSPDAPALALFTSGSEGTPKGVVLSHRNILSNCAQLGARIDFNPSDRVFNALPVFHSFGMTGGLLLPLLSGIKVFLYPSPLHYKIVPELCYDTNATVVFGTSTFLAGYAKHANPYDFYSVRYIFAGAERVDPTVRQTYMDKFGLRILEGYGATETSPVIAVNTPMHFKAGSVGRLLPGLEHRLEAVPGVSDGSRLWVHGPNVMLGYLKADAPGVLQPPEDGWYDTGDIVAVDDDGFVTIRGRAKRFVKIGGEMVSLGAVEAAAAALWPGHAHAAVGVPDPKKGEQVVLVTDQPDADRPQLLADARGRGASELTVPRVVLVVDKVPLLGTGKTDYPAVQRLVATPAARTADADADEPAE